MSWTPFDRTTVQRLLRNEADMAFRRRTLRLMEWLDLNDGASVLDAGCGTGFQLMVMSALRHLQLTGIDSDRKRLQHARQEVPPVAVAQVDLHQLPFAGESFDRVLCTEVLEHLQDDASALREMYRCLRPGGLLAISVPHARYPFLWDPINRVWTGLGGRPIRGSTIAGIWSGHVRLCEPAQLAACVRQAGFAIETVEEATHHCFPFIHFLVYGLGRPLLEKNLLPPAWRRKANRFSGLQNDGFGLHPFNMARTIFRWFDRQNDEPKATTKRTFVNVLLLARKPS